MTPLEVRVRADGRAPALVRAALDRWLAARNWPDEDGEDLVFAVSEAVSNAAEHAYHPDHADESAQQPEPLVAVVVTELVDADVRRAKAVVVDFGAWRSQPSGDGTRGRGLTMIGMLVASCTVNHGRAGTRVTMISRPVPRRRPRNPHPFGPEHG
jgi:anti-sigma regulatory factor (Ser/Thr protein kinase)